MKCPECQTRNPETRKFCRECGTKLLLLCPKCGSENLPGDKFCGECGHDLKEPIEVTPIDYDQPTSYTPKHLADKILTTRSSIEGERKLVTVMFADVADSTAIFENLDPEDVHQIMDGYFKILMDEIHRHEGTINQFRGDGIMALFGAPIAHEDHAQRACHASLAIQSALDSYAEKLKTDYGITLKTRIGLNTGPVVVGSIGDDLRMDYTAKGDTSNLASRMESHAEAGTTLISENTHRLARDYFEFGAKGKIRVKGKEAPVEAYQLLKAGTVETRIRASETRGLTRFVGRGREIETLKEAFEKAHSGQGQVVGIVGEAGVGKSRLLYELRDVLPRGEYNYFEGHCLHYGSSMPYLPLLDVFRSYVGIKEGDPEPLIKKKMRERILGLDENLRSVIPPLQELLSLQVDDEAYAQLEPKQKREKTFEAIRDLLIRGSQEKPLTLAVEDLHWIDKTSEEFLDYMIGWLANTHILLLLLYRPEYTHAWGSKSYYRQIGVDQLSAGTSAELVTAILKEGDVLPEIRDLILSRAAGNPLFMEELTHSLLENGTIHKKEDRYVLKAKPSDIHVPETIQGIIAARMDRLEEDLKRIMQVASVIGREFAFRILHAITEMKEDLKSNLLNLQGLEFIYEKSLFPELEYIFRHALTQEVAYNSLLVKRRKEIHEKIARAIEELYPARLEDFYEVLAHHYSGSENKAKACHYLKLSGDKAWHSFSASEALTFYKGAIKLLREQGDTQDNLLTRLEIFQSMGYPIRMLGFPAGSIEFLEEGESLAQELKDQKVRAYFQTNIGIYYLTAGGDPLKGRAYIERGLKGSELTDEVELIVPATDDMISSYMIEGKYPKVCEIAPKLIALIEKTQTEDKLFGRPSNQYSILHGYYGLSLGALGKFGEGERLLEKGLSYARDVDNSISIAQVEMVYGAFYLFKGDFEKMLKHWLSSTEYMEKSQFRMFQGPLWAWLGLGYLYSGQTDNALQYAKQGLEMHTQLGMNVWLGSIHSILGEVYLDLGDFEKSLYYAERGVRLSRKNNEKSFEAESRLTLGRVIAAIAPMKFDEARENLQQGLNMLDGLQIKSRYTAGLVYLGELYAVSGQKEAAFEHLKKAEAMSQEMGMDYWFVKTQEILRVL